MPSDLETILVEFHERLKLLVGPVVLRNVALPTKIAPGGVLILRDGIAPEPDVSLSPLRYYYEHRAEIEVLVQTKGNNDSLFSSLTRMIGSMIESDRTLGGLCDFMETTVPETSDVRLEGALDIKAAVLTVVIHYATTSPI